MLLHRGELFRQMLLGALRILCMMSALYFVCRGLGQLEAGYGISLLKLTLFAQELYPEKSPLDAALAAITIIQLKLEGQVILRNPEFGMQDRLLLEEKFILLWSDEEIAKTLGVSKSSVRVYVMRARRAVLALCREDGYAE